MHHKKFIKPVIHKTLQSLHFRGFSLVELLMALLVASLLLAALAPVMTKKFHENVSITSAGAQMPINSCVLVNDSFEDIEKECVVPDDTAFASAIIVSGGAGGSGAMSSVEANEDWKLAASLTGNDNTYNGDSATILSAEKTISFGKNIKAIKVRLVGGGAGGGGGNYGYKFNPSASVCKNYGIGKKDTNNNMGSASNPLTVYDPANNLCITRFNQKTASGCKAYSQNNYSTVYCTHSEAIRACDEFSTAMQEQVGTWMLPTKAQQENWTSSFLSSASNLGGCDGDKDHTPYCPVWGGYPYFIWSDTVRSISSASTCYYGSSLMAGNKIIESYCKTSAYDDHGSVRCARGAEYLFYKGGGASSSSFLEYEIPKKVIKQAAESGNGKLRFHAQNGGKSGEYNKNGFRPGWETWAGLYDSAGNYLQAVALYAGYSGAAATTDADGGVGKPIFLEMCWNKDVSNDDYNNGDKSKSVECSQIPGIISYKKGISGSGVTGGASVWPGGTYGAGGNGGVCQLGDDGNPKCTAGTGGRGGRVEIYFKYAYPGAGGSGGNAGSFLHIKNIQVKPGDRIKIQAGKAGTGGMPDNGGGAGGNSIVEFPNGKKYEVIGGKPALPGSLANPATGAFAKSGNIENIAANDVITPSTRALLQSNDEVYPLTTEERALLKGLKAQETTDFGTQRLSGGNGGVNPKISGLAGARGIPCGGYSETSITINKTTYDCANNKQLSSVDYNPAPLYRTLTENDMKLKISNYIHNYAPGATGGGGGAWSNDFNDTTEKIGRGQDGMGGYVIIYFSS